MKPLHQPLCRLHSLARIRFRFRRSLWGGGLALGLWGAIAFPSRSAETLRVTWADTNLDLPVSVLETFQKTGQFDRGFGFLNVLVPETTLKEARNALRARLPLAPEVLRPVLTNTDTLEIFLQQVGSLIRPEPGESGAAALKQALLTASEQPQGLTLIGLIQSFPGPLIQIDLDTGLRLFRQIRALEAETGAMLKAIAAQMQQQATVTTGDYQPAQRGSYTVRQQSWDWVDRDRDRRVPTTIYWPDRQGLSLPLVIISHGLGEDRGNFAYLAQFLASHGFVVVLPEHLNSSSRQFASAAAGFANPPGPQEAIDRPQDIRFVLDRLVLEPQWRNRVNIRRVAVIGHSYGGVTALMLAGAVIEPEKIRAACSSVDRLMLVPSASLQCSLGRLPRDRYDLRDPRVVAILPISPFASQVFEPKALNQVQVPTLLWSGSADLIVPTLAEAIQPFQHLGSPNKHLVIALNATHFSVLGESQGPATRLPPALLGPSPELGRRALKQVSLSFLQTYLLGQRQAKAGLTPAAAEQLSNPVMPLLFSEQLPPAAIAQQN
ncbi:alpha/beta fold hydrolase [Synechococcus elongatus IITB7]|uniref:alpha/beta hydrolase n=1 Tax=Synechococcus elongatus TaxID=32046 RepID=UPI0030CD2773